MESSSLRNNFSAWSNDQGASDPSKPGNIQPVYDVTREYRPPGSQAPPLSYPGLVCTGHPSPGYGAGETLLQLQVDIPSNFSSHSPAGPGPYQQVQPQTPILSPFSAGSGFTHTPPSYLTTPSSVNQRFHVPIAGSSPLQSSQGLASTGISPIFNRWDLSEKWSFPYSPNTTSRLQGAGDHFPVTQGGQEQLGLYQAAEPANQLENLPELSSLHHFPSESQGHDPQSALYPPGPTGTDDYSSAAGDAFPRINTNVSQVPDETQGDYDQYYTSPSATSTVTFTDPQSHWTPTPGYLTNVTSTTSHQVPAVSDGAVQDEFPFWDHPLVWPGYAEGSPPGPGRDGGIALAGKLEDDICHSSQSPGADPSTSFAGMGRGAFQGPEDPKVVIRKKDGASAALRTAADRRRTRPRVHICSYCPDSFTSRQNLQNHINTHQQLYPFTCWVCNKKYRHSRSLNRHLSKAHGLPTNPRQRRRE